MRRGTAWCGAGMAVIAVLVSAVSAQPPPGHEGPGKRGGGPGGPPRFDPQRMMAMGAIEAYWLALTFDPKVPDAKLTQLRPKFQQAWDARKKAFDAAWQKHDPEAGWDDLKKVNSTLEGAIKSALGEAQLKKLKETMKRRAMPPRGAFGGPAKRKGG